MTMVAQSVDRGDKRNMINVACTVHVNDRPSRVLLNINPQERTEVVKHSH